MIISASRRTDIPAFYTDWFMNRIREGFFHRVNPFNANQISGFSLKPKDVDAICFWTKNPKPLMPYLNELDQLGFNYYFQFTLNHYDNNFEPNVSCINDRIETFQELSDRIGSNRVVWRYDPVILSSATPVNWHLDEAESVAERLSSSTHRLVFSFYDFYGKGQGRLYKALQGTGVDLEDITALNKADELMALVEGLKAVSERFNYNLLSCSEELDLSAIGVDHGACIDGKLIQELFGGNPSNKKDKNQRQACGCVESVDMGMYNTCNFRCTYCYANFNEGMIDSNLNKHFKESPSLLGQCEDDIEIQTSMNKKKCCRDQQSLF